jgi:transposase
MRATRPTYSPEFKDDAVNLLRTSERSFRQVADDLGVSIFSLRQWYKQREVPQKAKKKGRAATAPTPLQEESVEAKLVRVERELKELRKENDQLRMDREILKKAAAFFAKEKE